MDAFAKKTLRETEASLIYTTDSMERGYTGFGPICSPDAGIQKVRSYKDYGDRGIKVCDEWLIFENFYKWAIQSGYKENLTIDRIDVDGDYSPSNCRWATTKEQARNKRTSRIITYNGNEKVLQDWAHEYSINPSTLRARIESGWNIEDALRKPIK